MSVFLWTVVELCLRVGEPGLRKERRRHKRLFCSFLQSFHWEIRLLTVPTVGLQFFVDSCFKLLDAQRAAKQSTVDNKRWCAVDSYPPCFVKIFLHRQARLIRSEACAELEK